MSRGFGRSMCPRHGPRPIDGACSFDFPDGITLSAVHGLAIEGPHQRGEHEMLLARHTRDAR